MEDLPEDTMMSPMKYQAEDNKFQERVVLVNVRTEDPAVVTTRREEAQEEAV